MESMTDAQKSMRVHNAGPNRPLLTHEEYVSYLYECAKLWAAKDHTQARLVLSKAQKMDRHPDRCEVCKRHGALD